MNRFKNHFIVLAAFALLAVVGTIMNSHQASAQNPVPGAAPVKIVSPIPVPITGATTVSGTIAATQSGAWNVGITGTPNVNITNTPTVGLANGSKLQIFNLDEPGRTPYQRALSASICSTSSCTFTFPSISGGRLVVTHISGTIVFRSGSPASPVRVSIASTDIFQYPFSNFTSSDVAGGVTTLDHAVQFYVDEPKDLNIGVFSVGSGIDTSNEGSQEITLTGYVVDCSTEQCSAIKQ